MRIQRVGSRLESFAEILFVVALGIAGIAAVVLSFQISLTVSRDNDERQR
ncbi:MAG: hypothetical protein MZW92_16330 [Comamonadaceae bacterium]|nr:hypothetical protein [Comamonadaceae bacterium]